MTNGWAAFDLLTATLWFALSLVGVVLRVRRLLRLHRIRLAEPVHPLDAEYLASIKRSTGLRLFVKVAFLVGSLVALLNLPWLWPFWRVMVVLALAAMVTETVTVDRVRDRLGRALESGTAA